jgi:8-oxo-dGTP pyrophosphatase MutT (NUDIX family)
VIVGLKQTELDAIEANSLAKKPVLLRPRDSASLVLLDRSGPKVLVLLGKRRADLAFMPGQFVFPGGRTDPADRLQMAEGALSGSDLAKLMAGFGARPSRKRAEALAITALRECYEETGLIVGVPCDTAGVFGAQLQQPNLSALRLVARAITPPGRVRRFDTRFFAAWRDQVSWINPEGAPEQEFSELRWIGLADTDTLDCPAITRTIIAAVMDRLRTDPHLQRDCAVPEFRMRHRRFVREDRA